MLNAPDKSKIPSDASEDKLLEGKGKEEKV